MYLAFTIPMLALIVTIVIFKLKIKIFKYSNKLFNYGIITLTIGSIVKGALDIYGTTNKLVYLYLIISIILFCISLIIHIIRD